MSRTVMTRRTMLRGVLVGGAGLFLASCGGAAQTQTSDTGATQASTAASTASAGNSAVTASTETVSTNATSATASPAATTSIATTASPASASSTATTAAAASAAKPAAKATTVAWWMTATGDDLTAFEIAPKSYMAKNPQITIEVTSIASAGLTKVDTAIAAGTPPELTLTWDRAGSSGIYYKGGIQVLDDYMKADKDFDISVLESGSVKGLQSHDGKQYALPNQIYPVSHLFYNTKMFKDKGLDPTKPPTTLDDLEKTAALFDVKKGDQVVAIGFHPTQNLNSQVYPFAYGGKFFDAGTGKITPDDPGVVAGLEWLVKYYQKYGVDNMRRLSASYGNAQSAQNPFLAGQVAMTGFWDALVAYRNRYAPSIEYAHAWFPYAAEKPETKGFGMINFNPNFITKGAKEKDTAWDITKFMSMDQQSCLQMAIALANTPQNLKSIALPEASQADPILRQCWDYAAKGTMQSFPPTMPGQAEYSTEWNRQLDLMLAGKVSVSNGVKAIKDAVQPVVDKVLKA